MKKLYYKVKNKIRSFIYELPPIKRYRLKKKVEAEFRSYMQQAHFQSYNETVKHAKDGSVIIPIKDVNVVANFKSAWRARDDIRLP